MSSWRITNHSSSSEDDLSRYASITDEKKRKRMISNRESARRSRMKREQHIKDLNDQVTYYTTKRATILQKMDRVEESYAAIAVENEALRMQVDDLTKRLQLLDQFLVSSNSSDTKCSGKDILQVPSPTPWQQQQQPLFRSR
ncbi:bZIP transcription factor 53-like [Andrographis paniculata]|uniref:bZIP transcription factor 53-like n=1 Tax=Andrographis paniculata TaxID=175694 RepID=UPI0021E8A5CA|nr:bZIP transcription factor 53-like [Andrographis paniculata]